VPQRLTVARAIACALCLAALAGCTGTGEMKNLGGTLTGLDDGTSVTIKNNNNGDTMTLTRDGPFQFPIFVADSTPYTVVITAQPPGQNCTVTNGAGTMHSSVDNIQVNCA
jgi:hypothetical protein